MELSARPVTWILISGALVSCGPGAMEGEGRGFHLSSSVSLLRIFKFHILDRSTEESRCSLHFAPGSTTWLGPCAFVCSFN